MKKLIVVRHAKSDWGTEFLKDIDRPLNNRGYTDAYFMSDWFFKYKPVPDMILSSTASRALNTALIFARTMSFNMKNFALNNNLYESTPQTILDIVKSSSDEHSSLMIFCHNPGITHLCNDLMKDVFIDNVPTCGIVGIKFSVDDWKQISNVQSELDFYQFPKNFKNTD
jgi:phosphohistidine phosphatase